jgi:hypothetical protein
MMNITERSDLGPVLIDLSKDPAENVDRSKEFPARVRSMQILAKELLLEIEKNRSLSEDLPLQKRES